MTKSELEKALADVDRGLEPRGTHYVVSYEVVEAARRFADLKGKECGTCVGSGVVGKAWIDPLDPYQECRTCHGSGKVWNPEAVERVAQALEPWEPDYGEAMARAVLAALSNLDSDPPNPSFTEEES